MYFKSSSLRYEVCVARPTALHTHRLMLPVITLNSEAARAFGPSCKFNTARSIGC